MQVKIITFDVYLNGNKMTIGLNEYGSLPHGYVVIRCFSKIDVFVNL